MPQPVLPPTPESLVPLPPLTLVTGGARSGKSAFAEAMVLAEAGRWGPPEAGGGAVYLATAPTTPHGNGDAHGNENGGVNAADAEMDDRIRRHRARRGPVWTTVEEPLDVPGLLTRLAAGLPALDAPPPGRPVLVDCLTLWLSNLMVAGHDIDAATDALLAATDGTHPRRPVVLVTNEVGLGIVPDNALARAFRDHAGRMNQRIAAAAQRVVVVACGLPLVLKDIISGSLDRP